MEPWSLVCPSETKFEINSTGFTRLGVPMYAVVGETLGADEFEAKFFKGKVGIATNHCIKK